MKTEMKAIIEFVNANLPALCLYMILHNQDHSYTEEVYDVLISKINALEFRPTMNSETLATRIITECSFKHISGYKPTRLTL